MRPKPINWFLFLRRGREQFGIPYMVPWANLELLREQNEAVPEQPVERERTFQRLQRGIRIGPVHP